MCQLYFLQLDHLSSSQPSGKLADVSFAPTKVELKNVRADFAVLVGRILCSHFQFLQPFLQIVQKPVYCRYAKELSQPSVIVSLGVLDKNEAKHSDMTDILRFVQREVRQLYAAADVQPPTTAEAHSPFFTTFGGDQLTAERTDGAQLICASSGSRRGRLEEVIPVCENWHAGLILLSVFYECLYSSKSQKDAGTLYHLRQVGSLCLMLLLSQNTISSASSSSFSFSYVFTRTTIVTVFSSSQGKKKANPIDKSHL